MSGRASYRWFAIALLAASSCYTWYVLAQYGRLNELNQRQLSNAAADLKATLETAIETVVRFDARVKAAQAGEDANDGDRTRSGQRPSLCDFDANQPYLELAACTRSDSPAPNWTVGPNAKIDGVAGRTLGVKPSGTDDDLSLEFRADTLFRELASVDGFELIFVANKDGDVLYQDAPAGRRWSRYLRRAEQAARDARADRSPAIRIQNVRQVVGGNPDTWAHLRAVSSRERIQLGGTTHQLYLQPVGLKVQGWEDLVVGAVVPSSWIIRDALAIDADLLGFLVFLVLLGLLGFPFVKLIVLHRQERFRMRDVTLLYFSTGALVVLLTCASFALDGYRRWHWEADKGLETWSGHIARNVVDELGAIRDQLVQYDGLLKSRLSANECGTVHTDWFLDTLDPQGGPTALSWPPRPPTSLYLRQVGWIRSDGQQAWKTTADPIPGLIRVNRRPYVVAVQNRELFQIAPDTMTASTPNEARPFFFGPDRSITDGKFYTFVSIPSDLPPTTCADDAKSPIDGIAAGANPTQMPSVLATSGLLLSLDRQAMPAGYGFALISREGRVLYHSDRRLSLRENLFDELSQSARVRAQIYAGLAGSVTTRYRERPHELYLRPIDRLRRAGEPEPAGFYVVAFRDTSVERAIVGHEFVAGLVGPMLVLFALGSIGLAALAGAARFVVEDRWGAWLWPHGGLGRVYKRQAIAFAVLLLVSLVLCTTRYAIVAALAPLAAAGIGVVIYMHGKKDKTDRCRLDCAGWHTAALLLLIVCMVVVPSGVFFRLALSYEFGKLIYTERSWIAAQRADAARDAESDVPRGHYGMNVRCAHEQTRRRFFSANTIPAPFDLGLPPEPSGPPVEPTVRPAANLRSDAEAPGAVPVIGDCPEAAASADMQAAWPPRADQEAGVTVASLSVVEGLDFIDDMLPIENEVASRTHFQESRLAYSPPGPLGSSLRMTTTAFVGLGVTLALLGWWIRWNTNRLFLADYEPKAVLPEVSAPFQDVLQKRSHEEQILLLHIARERIANPRQRRTVERLLDAGLLRLCPDLRPWPPAFEAFLLETEEERHAEVASSECVTEEHSWHSARLILATGIAGLGFFLVVTQPGLQSTLLGLAGGLTSALTTGLKLRDAISSWLPGRKTSAT